MMCGAQVKKLQAEKRLDLLVDADLKSMYNSLELEEMVQVRNNLEVAKRTVTYSPLKSQSNIK